MNKPNLFKYATKELSQDAFICWLLDWAHEEYKAQDENLHDLGLMFVKSLLAKKSPKSIQINSFQILPQFKNMDVLVLINTTTDDIKRKSLPLDAHAIIIEDKVKADQHGNQLEKYNNVIEKLGFNQEQLTKIYLKTIDQANYKKIEPFGYIPYSRKDFLSVLNKYSGQNQILLDFRMYWETIDQKTKSYKSTSPNKWDNDAWTGFYKELSKNFNEGKFGKDSFGNKSKPTYGGFITLQKRDCVLYMQLCKDRLNFKVRDVVGVEQKELRVKWTKLLSDISFGSNIKIEMKKSRVGKAMVVGYLDNYLTGEDGELLKEDGGIVSVVKTIERLKDFKTKLLNLDINL